MTYWAHAAWCITQNLQSFQVSCTVNIQTSTHPSNKRRINVQYCIMSTCCIMTAGYFPFERMPEWGCGLQSMNTWCGLSLKQTQFSETRVPVFFVAFSIMEDQRSWSGLEGGKTRTMTNLEHEWQQLFPLSHTHIWTQRLSQTIYWKPLTKYNESSHTTYWNSHTIVKIQSVVCRDV